MNKFAEAFKAARLKSGKKFREIAEATKLTIGYLSDLDSGRRPPPEYVVVRQIEKFLGVTAGELVELAREERAASQPFDTLLKNRPILAELLLRADELEESQLAEIVSQIQTKAAESNKDKSDLLYSNELNCPFPLFQQIYSNKEWIVQ